MTGPTPTQRPVNTDPTGRPNGDRTADPTPVPVADAARRLGLSTEAVRMRLKRGTLAGAKVNGHWMVLLPPAPTPTQRDPTADPTPTEHRTQRPTNADPTATQQAAAATDALITTLQSEVAYLRDQLDQRSRELAAERERFDVLHREALARIQPPALPTREPSGEDAPATRSEAPHAPNAPEATASTPAPARRPWWRWLFGWGQ